MKYDCKSKQFPELGDITMYTHKEFCDFCTSSEDIQKGTYSNKIPNTEELDFCIYCLRRLMDRKIPYHELVKNSFLIIRNNIQYRVYPNLNGEYFIPGDYYILVSEPGWSIHICASIDNKENKTIIISTEGCRHNAQECFKINPVHLNT